MSEVVGSLSIELLLDRSKYDRDLERLKSEGFTVGVKVDTKSLQRQLQSLELDCIPVKICPDIDGFRKKLKELNAESITIDAQLASGGLKKQLDQLTNRQLTVTIDTAKSEAAIRRLNQEVDALRANIRSLNQEQVVAPRVVAAPRAQAAAPAPTG